MMIFLILKKSRRDLLKLHNYLCVVAKEVLFRGSAPVVAYGDLFLDTYPSYLSSHDALSLLNEPTLGALAVAVHACLLVATETGYQPVVAAPGAFWHASATTVHLFRIWINLGKRRKLKHYLSVSSSIYLVYFDIDFIYIWRHLSNNVWFPICN